MNHTERPKIVCLCGSTRFLEAFAEANLRETLDGKIVLSVGCYIHSDDILFADMSPQEKAAIKAKLDALHLAKIDLADEVLILNVGGYIGESTQHELDYARRKGKFVRFLCSPDAAAVSMPSKKFHLDYCKYCHAHLMGYSADELAQHYRECDARHGAPQPDVPAVSLQTAHAT